MKILVLRDFDKAGFSIVHTLRTDTRRYQFKTPPKVVDLGLRLTDVEKLGLTGEVVNYASNKDPRINLRECGATEAECKYLVHPGCSSGGGWDGMRVELNAMTSPQFVEMLEAKLVEQGVAKVVPGKATLEDAWHRAWHLAEAQEAANEVLQRAEAGISKSLTPPPDLDKQVRQLVKNSDRSWDEAVWLAAKKQRDATEPELLALLSGRASNENGKRQS